MTAPTPARDKIVAVLRDQTKPISMAEIMRLTSMSKAGVASQLTRMKYVHMVGTTEGPGGVTLWTLKNEEPQDHDDVPPEYVKVSSIWSVAKRIKAMVRAQA
jgi:Fe2+ or Zn2+ uptake regulation protein